MTSRIVRQADYYGLDEDPEVAGDSIRRKTPHDTNPTQGSSFDPQGQFSAMLKGPRIHAGTMDRNSGRHDEMSEDDWGHEFETTRDQGQETNYVGEPVDEWGERTGEPPREGPDYEGRHRAANAPILPGWIG